MKSNPSHIALLCSRLDMPGGIERAVVNTAALFAGKGHEVTLLILDETSESFYPVHPAIKIIQQPLSFGITPEGNIITRKIKLLSDVLKLRRILKQINAGIIIASEYPFAAAAILAGARKQAKVIAWEHHHYYELKRNLFWNKIFRITYPRLDAIVCLNKDEQKLFALINPQSVVVPNFISIRKAADGKREKIILTVARLTTVKGIRYLLEAAKTILPANPGWKWKLIGDGELKEEVLAFIEKENLSAQFILQTPVSHAIASEYQQASLYVMTSVNECFPMTLLEAQASGLPCIAFDCETGPRHIITGETGILVPKKNPQELATAIQQLINNEAKMAAMGLMAMEQVTQFSEEAVYKQWQHLVLTL